MDIIKVVIASVLAVIVGAVVNAIFLGSYGMGVAAVLAIFIYKLLEDR